MKRLTQDRIRMIKFMRATYKAYNFDVGLFATKQICDCIFAELNNVGVDVPEKVAREYVAATGKDAESPNQELYCRIYPQLIK